ncbi:MAG: PD40 domain-containing protein [Pyrinomonadaceae bacterium]|nr:PD40 domain-containing protein [Pyrinomonadaceae bacterium]
MSSQYDQERAALQAKLDSLRDGVTLKLPPQEYPGPIEIKHPMTLDGQGATVWARHGAVINVLSDGVVLRNLKIEVTGGDTSTRIEGECALSVEPNRTIQLENVEVRGSVIGLCDEEGAWLYPSSLHLGSLDFGSEHDLILRIYVPVDCRFSSSVSGLMVQPTKLTKGPNEVRLHVERLPQDTLLNGSFLLTTTRLVRRISVHAHIAPAPPVSAKKPGRSKKPPKEAPKPAAARVVWQPDNWDALLAGQIPSTGRSIPVEPPPISQPGIKFVDDDDDSNAQPVVTAPPMAVVPEQTEKKKTSVQPPPSQPPENQAPIVPGPSPAVASTPPAQQTPAAVDEEIYNPSLVTQPQPPPVKTLPSGGLPAQPPAKPVVSPPTGSGTGSAPAYSPTPTATRSGQSSRLIFMLIGAVLLLALLGVGGWYFFGSGAKAINYSGITYLKSLSGADEVTAVAFAPDGTIAGATKGGKIKLWDATGDAVKMELPKASESSPGEITSIAFSPDGTMLVAGTADNNLILWKVATGERKTLRGHLGRVNAVAFASDNRTILSGAEDGTAKFWDAQSTAGAPQRSVPLDGPVKAVAASSDGTVAAATDKGTIKRWDVASGSAKRDISRSGAVLALAFSPDGKLLAGGTADATVVLWKTETGAQDKTLRGPKAEVNAVAFSPDGRTVISGGNDTVVHLWDAVDGGAAKRALTQNTGAVYSVAVSPDGKIIASGGADKTVKMWSNK